MSARPDTHPTDSELQDYARGRLDDASTRTVLDHVEACSRCSNRLAELPDNSLWRAAKTRGSFEPPPPRSAAAGQAAAEQTRVGPPLAGVPPELAQLTGYEIERELGRGGMGVVYLARNTLMDRPEVLKVMNRALVGRPEAVDRFLQEIRSAGRLSHPNVATAHSAHQLGDVVVLAMEYVDGDDLSKVVHGRGPLSVVNACYCTHQAALGLQRAFELGMVHRDIKPGNILLAKHGKRAVVKIVDFGLAKARSETPAGRELTGTNQMMGTLGYTAPEQLQDAKAADIRSDIYSLGCTLHFLLTGEPPFAGSSAYAVLLAQEAGQVRPLSESRPDAPAGLAAVLAKMMARDPAERFQRPADLAAALVPFIKPGDKPAANPKSTAEMLMAETVVPTGTRTGPAPVPTRLRQGTATVVPSLPVRPRRRWTRAHYGLAVCVPVIAVLLVLVVRNELKDPGKPTESPHKVVDSPKPPENAPAIAPRPVKYRVQRRKEPDQEALYKKLAGPIEYPGIDDPKTTLQDALDQLASLYKVTFEAEEAAFKSMQADDVLKREVAVPTPIPPSAGKSLEEVLTVILSRIAVSGGARHYVKNGRVVISTWTHIPVTVEGSAEEVPLRDALDYIEDAFSIKFDTTAVKDKERSPVRWSVSDESLLGNVVDRLLRYADAELGDNPEGKPNVFPVVPRGQ